AQALLEQPFLEGFRVGIGHGVFEQHALDREADAIRSLIAFTTLASALRRLERGQERCADLGRSPGRTVSRTNGHRRHDDSRRVRLVTKMRHAGPVVVAQAVSRSILRLFFSGYAG